MDEEPSEKTSHSAVLDQSIYVNSKETTEEFDNKRKAIENACQNRDVKALVEHATSPAGLLTDTLRQAACMCDPFSVTVTTAYHHGMQGLYCSVMILRKKSLDKTSRTGKAYHDMAMRNRSSLMSTDHLFIIRSVSILPSHIAA